MDIQMVKAFFMWCMIVNLGILTLTSIMCMFFPDFSYRMNSKYFSISRDTFNVIMISFVGLFKMFVIVFSIAPYIAMEIIA